MTITAYRIQEANRDPRELLDPANWISRVWVGTVYRRCPDCVEGGTIIDGELATCPTCHGFAEVDDSQRRGVSACDSIDRLYRYFAERSAELDDCVIVELEGEISEDDDWEAERGALLLYPTRIVSVRPLDPADVEAYR